MTSNSSYNTEIVTDEVSLKRLEKDWNALYRRASEPNLSSSFDWTWHVWRTIFRRRGGRLCCLVIRSQGRAVLIWPMVVVRHHRLWRVAKPIGSTEPQHVLVEAGPDEAQLARLAWETMKADSGADLIWARRVRTGALLERVISEDPNAAVVEDVPAHYASWEAYSCWDHYWRSSSFRTEIDRRYRRLSEHGDLRFERLEWCERHREIAEWMIEQKKSWVQEKKKYSEWIGSEDYREFFTTAAGSINDFGKVVIFALVFDGKPIAAQLSRIGPSRVEPIHLTHDPAFEKWSPGGILMKHSLQWAYDNKLIYDLGGGLEPYKEKFRTHAARQRHFAVPASKWGYAHERMKQLSVLLRRVRGPFDVRPVRKLNDVI